MKRGGGFASAASCEPPPFSNIYNKKKGCGEGPHPPTRSAKGRGRGPSCEASPRFPPLYLSLLRSRWSGWVQRSWAKPDPPPTFLSLYYGRERGAPTTNFFFSLPRPITPRSQPMWTQSPGLKKLCQINLGREAEASLPKFICKPPCASFF